MKGLSWTALCGLVAVLQLCSSAKPNGGKFSRITQVLEAPASGKDADKSETHVVCSSLTFYNKGEIYLKMTGKTSNDNKSARVFIVVSVLRSECANIQHCDSVKELGHRIHNETSFLFLYDLESLATHDMIKKYEGSKNANEGSKIKGATTNTAVDDESRSGSRRSVGDEDMVKDNTTESENTAADLTPTPQVKSSHQTRADNATKYYNESASGLYIVYIESYALHHPKNMNITLTFTLEMKNFYGYLSAIDYPALVFYGVMTAVYAILGLVWSLAMCCSYKDLVRLQFWVFAVIILGFLEKVFFVSEYSSINAGEDPSFLILLAEGISAVKRGLARVLVIIVSLGFGTVKPRLGDSLGKVVAVGVIYCIFALIDGVVRAKAETYDTQDTSQIVTLALLFIMDSIIFYWAFTSLVSVRRALRLRKNYVKLSLYNHFAYTLIFAIIAAVAFTIWVFVEVNFPEGGCLKDWREVWLRDCFWHFLFCVILMVIMIIWRPSANQNRFAYSLVNDLEQDEEEEDEIENKNFETVKMRTISRGGGTPPPVSTQVEDDMKWVEENLPTTAMDKALPLLLDSDEEVMSTKFEASKMN